MPVTTKPPLSQYQQRPLRRLWKVPHSRAWWVCLAATLLFYMAVLAFYVHIVRARGFHDDPGRGPLAIFGILAFGIVMLTASYTLRRRFIRFLPGKARDWLWMHNWAGVITVMIAVLHANFDHVLSDFCYSTSCLSNRNWGPIALYALIVLVACGISVRLIDLWQTRVIVQEASSNGVGIVQALEERILELEYAIERLYAGKSEPFKQFCIHGIDGRNTMQAAMPPVPPNERADFQRACETLAERTRLIQSLQRQSRARLFMRRVRTAHIVVACIAGSLITIHVGITIIPALLYRLKL